MPGVFLDGVNGPGTIQEMSAERVYEALLYFFMKRQAATLNKAEKRAIAEHVSGAAPGSLVPPIDQIPQTAYCNADVGSSNDPLSEVGWSGWSPGLDNNRFQTTAAAGLTAGQVPDLELKWAFGLPGSTVVSMQPAVAGGRVVIGTSIGLIASLDADSGCIDWVQEVDYGVRAAPVIGPSADGGVSV
jgi:polyvinyl alcohol dehydrogenase (cytochrome)